MSKKATQNETPITFGPSVSFGYKLCAPFRGKLTQPNPANALPILIIPTPMTSATINAQTSNHPARRGGVSAIDVSVQVAESYGCFGSTATFVFLLNAASPSRKVDILRNQRGNGWLLQSWESASTFWVQIENNAKGSTSNRHVQQLPNLSEDRPAFRNEMTFCSTSPPSWQIVQDSELLNFFTESCF